MRTTVDGRTYELKEAGGERDRWRGGCKGGGGWCREEANGRRQVECMYNGIRLMASDSVDCGAVDDGKVRLLVRGA